MNTRRQFLVTGTQAAALLGTGMATAQAKSHYQSISTIKTNATQARSIAIGKQDEIIVAADKKILMFNSKGAAQKTIRLERAPRCLAVDPQGNLLVGFKNQVVRLDPTGKPLIEGASLDRSTVLTSLALSPQGEIWAADAGQHLIWRLDRRGNVIDKVKRPGSDFKSPKAAFPVSWSGDRLVVANPGRHAVETYSISGDRQSTWGERSRRLEGFSGCCNPVSLTTLSNGHIITAERGQPRIKLYDADGRFISLLAGPEDLANLAGEPTKETWSACETGGLEVEVDSKNRLIVLDRAAATIQILGRV